MQLSLIDDASVPTIRATKARYFEDARFRERILPPPKSAKEKRPDTPSDDWSMLVISTASSVARAGTSAAVINHFGLPSIALPGVPKIDYPPIRFVRFTGPSLTEGVERRSIEGIEVAISNPARTIVDCFRYRAKVGLDVALEGLREGLRQRKVTSDQLWTYGTKGKVWSTLKPYVEAMVADGA
ncbi:MAG: transcriptional regulator [Proteobacteria bacterium]|nr:transcriptional regulator [Pseudomonadota bacterium]